MSSAVVMRDQARAQCWKASLVAVSVLSLLLAACSDGPIVVLRNQCSHSVELAYAPLSDGAGSWEEAIPNDVSLAANETREFATIESHTIELRTADQQTVVGSFAVLGDEVNIVISGELCGALEA